MISKALLKSSAVFMLFGCASPDFEPRTLQSNSTVAENGSPALTMARAQFRNGNFALAAQHFRRAIREHPDEPAAYNGLAVCYDQMARFDLSRRYYEQALALAPTDGPTRNNYALSLRRQGLTERANDIETETASMMAEAIDSPNAEVHRTAEIEPISVPRLSHMNQTEAQSGAPGPVLQRMSRTEVALITSASSDLARSVRPAQTARAAHTTPAAVVRRTASGRQWSWELDRTPAVRASAAPEAVTFDLPAFAESTQAAVRQETEVASIVAEGESQLPTRQSVSDHIRSWNIADVAAQADIPRISVPPFVSAIVAGFASTFIEAEAPATTTAAQYPASAVRRTAEGSAWVFQLDDPVPEVNKQNTHLRILNGVGRLGQATRLRLHLRQSQGFGAIAVGDSAMPQDHSIITYPDGMRLQARALAAKLPFVSHFRQSVSGKTIIVTLGEDSVPFDFALQARFLLT